MSDEATCVACGTGQTFEIEGAEECPDCGEVALQQEGGCSVCQNCFYSPCK